MDLTQVAEVIEEIAATSGAKNKKELVKQYVEEEIFSKVVDMAYSQNLSYGFTDLPESVMSTTEDPLDLMLRAANTGNVNDSFLGRVSLACNYKDGGKVRELILKIARKDLRCGMKGASFNSIVPGWVYLVPYQRLKSFSHIDKLLWGKSEFVFQTKMDGMFAYSTPHGEFESRNGKKFELNLGLQSQIEEIIGDLPEPSVLMGELLVAGEDGQYLERTVGNGVINSYISGEGGRNSEIHYVIWGYVSEEDYERKKSSTPYSEILSNLQQSQALQDSELVHLVHTVPVESKEEAMKCYREDRDRDNEGGVVKDIHNLKWKDEQSGSKFAVKMKPTVEAEFEIVEAYYGDPNRKYRDHLGGLKVKSSCGQIVTKVGGGFTHEERMKGVDWWNEQIGKIVTIQFVGLVTDESDRETWCLNHSSFVETRFNEKEEADTYEYCVNLLKES